MIGLLVSSVIAGVLMNLLFSGINLQLPFWPVFWITFIISCVIGSPFALVHNAITGFIDHSEDRKDERARRYAERVRRTRIDSRTIVIDNRSISIGQRPQGDSHGTEKYRQIGSDEGSAEGYGEEDRDGR